MMSNQEAIKELEYFAGEYAMNGYVDTAEALEIGIKSIKKSEPMKPEMVMLDNNVKIGATNFVKGVKMYGCPTCGNYLSLSWKYCPECGQRISKEGLT